jgi:general secretion pathway protein J
VTLLSRQRWAGFTLVELLVAMTLLSLVVLALFRGVHFVGETDDRERQTMNRAVAKDEIGRLFMQQVASAFPVRTADANARVIFTGTADRLAFPILRPPGMGPGGLILAAFTIEPMANGSRLVYREFPFLPGSSVAVTDRPTRTSLIAELPERLRFSYHGASPGRADVWDIPSHLPRLLRLSDGETAIATAWPRALGDGEVGP